jgi:hypothetical protein
MGCGQTKMEELVKVPEKIPVGMDPANAKMVDVMVTQGPDAAAKAMIAEHTDASGKFDYFAMREQYG